LKQPLSEKAKGKQRAIESADDADDEADLHDAEYGFRITVQKKVIA